MSRQISIWIVNLATLLNLVCGLLAIVFIFDHEFITASYLILAGGIFDFIDGFLARTLKAATPFGAQLDSLTDLVTFGVAPGFLMYQLIESAIDMNSTATFTWSPALVAISIPVFAALRLARFTSSPSKDMSFSGLPTPAMAWFIVSLPFALAYEGTNDAFIQLKHLLELPWVLIPMTGLLSYLMIAPIRMMSLKTYDFSVMKNLSRYSFLLLAGILLLLFGFKALSIIIILYLLFSLFSKY